MTARRMVAILIGSGLVVLAAFTVLWSVVTTSTAQISASTSGSGSFTAGTVELAQPETSVALLFDAAGLYPGRTVTSCVSVVYEGSVPADVRLHASRSGGTGLEDHVELRLTKARANSCPADEALAQTIDRDQTIDRAQEDPGSPIETRPGTPMFTGLLGDLWRAHRDYDAGLVLVEGAETGDRLVLDAVIELVGGDDAQGLTTEFAIIIEARP